MSAGYGRLKASRISAMQKPELRRNRTGVQMSPIDTKKMLEPAEGAHLQPGDSSALEQIRAEYIREAGPIGSVPLPATAKGAAKAGIKALTGKRAQALIDKLGERLAFERSGTRLYEAMITKCRASGAESQRYLSKLEEIRSEEAAHFKLVKECIETLGADPTAQTPAADLAGVEALGLVQVVTDPMTSVVQSMHSMLVAELVDNDAWDELLDLAREIGQDDMARRFQIARDEEREHLETLRRWHKEATLQEAKLAS
jgi:rubrerythrin